MTKFCPRCQIDHSIENFYDTHCGGKMKHCKKCHNELAKEAKKARRARATHCPVAKEQHEKELAYNRSIRQKYLEEYKQEQREYYAKNREEIAKKRKIARDANKEEFNAKRRPTNNAYAKRRRATDPQYRVLVNTRCRIASSVARKSESSKDLIGCDLDKFMAHLESQFTGDMSWANYGTLWHIDHIKPVCSFDLTDSEQRKACFNWSNCRPLLAEDNLKKAAIDKKSRIMSDQPSDSRV